jgi:rod shape-determining protein MreD
VKAIGQSARGAPAASQGRLILALLLGIAVCSLQAAPRVKHLFFGSAPDALALLTVYFALRSETWLAAAAVFILGVARDAASLDPLGIFSLTLVLTVLLLKSLYKFMELSREISLMLLVLAVFFIINVVIYPILMYIFLGTGSFSLLWRSISGYGAQGLLTLLVAPLAFAFLDRACLIRETE